MTPPTAQTESLISADTVVDAEEEKPAASPSAVGAVVARVEVRRSRRGRARAFFRKVPWLPIITVVLPTTVSALYFGVFASDVFISESHFIVRSAQRPQTSGLTALLTTGTLARAQDDTYAVLDFMRSRDAMKRVDAVQSLRTLFGSTSIDRTARFNGFGVDGSEEALFKYYQKVVVVDFDATTGVAALRVHAFKAEDSHRMNEQLLQMSEALLNELNERARKDMIRFATAEVELAQEKARTATLALSSYRNENAVFDPERQSTLQLQAMSRLQDELIATTIQITQVRTLTPENPQLPSLEKRLLSIQGAIRDEMSKVTGGKSSLSGKAADFERLAMERTFAEKQLATALTALEQARSDAQHKQLYLERIAQPSVPDIGVEPRRLRSVLATFIVGLLAWGIFSMLIAGIREHRD
jgi:capsular polysaccharide transport system permease protein